jgi:type I restriction enzyme S subunit
MSEWVESSLNQLVTFQKGRKVDTAAYAQDGYDRYLGASGIGGQSDTDGYASTRLAVVAKPSDVLMLWDGERSGLVGYGRQGVVASTVSKLTPNSKVTPGFLFYTLAQSFDWIQNRRTGTGVPHVPKDLGRILRLKLPKSLIEQQKIAAILTGIDTAIEKTEALIEKYRQIKAGLMHDLFTRGVLPNGQLRPPREQAPELYQETAIGWIPTEWGAGRLAEYLDPANGIKPGPFGSSLTKDQYTSTGFRIYGQEQVIAGSLAIGDYYISAAKFAEMRAFEVVENDVLLSLVGTVGCVLVASAPFEPGIINPRLIRLRPAPKKVSADFLKYLLLTNEVGRQIDNLSGGGTMPVINGKVIRRIGVPILNIAEQTLIVDRLGALERQLSSAINQLSKLKSQKLGLMQDLLTGKVPVKVGAGETANG